MHNLVNQLFRSLIGVSLLAAGVAGWASKAQADGEMNFYLNSNSALMVVHLHEQGGQRYAELNSLGMRDMLYQETDPELKMDAGPDSSSLFITRYPNGQRDYVGRLFPGSGETVSMHFLPEDNKGEWRLNGAVGKVKFEVYANPKKRTFQFNWPGFTMSLSANSSGGAGDCRGELYSYDNFDRSKIFCDSTGKLEDAFFRNPEDVIALMIRTFVTPEDQDGGGSSGGNLR